MDASEMKEKLLALRFTANSSVEEIARIISSLTVPQAKRRFAIDEYNQLRRKLVLEELRTRQLSWCTRWMNLIPEQDATLVLREGKEEKPCGYENSEIRLAEYSRIERVCPECLQNFSQRHNKPCKCVYLDPDLTIFYVFSVGVRDGEYWVKRFGDWEKIGPDTDVSYVNKFEYVEELKDRLREWGIPPSILLDSAGGIAEL